MPDGYRIHYHYDVAISGAGPAGASLAVRLARAGARVILLDAHRFPRAKLCGEYLSPEGAAALERLGVALGGTGYHPIRRLRLTTPRGSALEADVVDRDGRPGVALSRAVLDALIVDAAVASGADWRPAHRVTGPLLSEGRVVGVSARDARGARVEIRATVVIAADGRHSTLVRQTGATRAWPGFWPRLLGIKRHFDGAGADADEPEGAVGLHCIPGGYVGTCRIEAGWTNLCALVPERVAARRRGDLDRVLVDLAHHNPALAPLVGARAPAGAWSAVAGVRIETARPTRPGILYVGDCCGTVDPLGGQGMTMALLGSELLASLVREALARGVADAEIQRRWHATWRRRFGRRVALCRAYHHALVHPAILDVGAGLGGWGARLLRLAYGLTRDPAPA
jgi:flavin-dependent dehydrogenase